MVSHIGEPERETLPRQRKLLPPDGKRDPEMDNWRQLATAQKPAPSDTMKT